MKTLDKYKTCSGWAKETAIGNKVIKFDIFIYVVQFLMSALFPSSEEYLYFCFP